jgi:salicylate hydroxylase
MQIEDAEVLGSLFSRLRDWDQIPHLAEAFQELREPRTRAIYAKETKAFSTVWMPPGPQRDARDQTLYAMMVEGHKGWDETSMRWQWDEICDVFGYNARDAAEDWWVMWGMLRERSMARDDHSIYTVPFCMGEVVTQTQSQVRR